MNNEHAQLPLPPAFLAVPDKEISGRMPRACEVCGKPAMKPGKRGRYPRWCAPHFYERRKGQARRSMDTFYQAKKAKKVSPINLPPPQLPQTVSFNLPAAPSWLGNK